MDSQVEIRTSHNIVVYYELASPWERVLALVIDLMVMSLLMTGVVFLFASIPGAGSIMQILFLLIVSFYHLLFEVFNGGQSPGKKLLKTKVVNLSGVSPTPGEALLRWIFRLLDVTMSLGCVAGLCIISSPKNQRVGDLVSGCIVIKTKERGDISLSRIMSIQQREHTVTYPQVTRYTEKDMVLIKEVLSRHAKWKNASTKKAIIALSDKIAADLKVNLSRLNRKELLENVVKDYVVLTR